MNKDYLKNIINLLEKLENTQDRIIDQVADICAECIYNGGLLYFFGTGHSHMICEEPFYRAGGLACIYPILERDLLQKKLASNEAELEQLQHQQRLENRIAYYEKADRKKRTHRLCTTAGTMESIAPELRELTTPEVIELLEQIFELSNVRYAAHNAVLRHREKEEKSIGSVSPERHTD